jgi:cytochrome c oxidase subunit II
LLGPETAHSPNAEDITTIYWVMLAVAGVLILSINGALVFCLLRFRLARGRSPSPSRLRSRLPAGAAAGLALVSAALFVAGVVYTHKASDVAKSGPNGLTASSLLTAQRGLSLPQGAPDPLRIRAVGQQWIWRYEYPSDSTSSGPADPNLSASTPASFNQLFSYYELVVPVDTTVVLSFDSTDVVHRWWVPELGGKFDATPGAPNQTWFRADEEGTYQGQSAAFSGASYAVMRTQVRVVSAPEYQAWLTKQAADIKAAQTSVQEQLAANGGPPGQTAGTSQ